MRKFIFTFIAVIIVGFIVVCLPKLRHDRPEQTKSDTIASDSITNISEDESERLAFWFPRHDSLNHELVLLAEHLWKLDSAAANGDNNERNKWFRECKTALIHGFDSIHPHSTAPNYIKVDSMLSEIEAFFEEDADYSTMGMIVNFDLQNSFLFYRMTDETFQILEYEPLFRQEIEAWEYLHKAMNDFCLGIVNLDWFGGSGAGPASLATRNMIIQSRIDDMKNIHRVYADDYPMSATNIKHTIDVRLVKSKSEFVKAVEKVASAVSNVEESKDYLPEDRLQDYKALYDKVQGAKSPLLQALNDWEKLRIKIIKADNNNRRRNALLQNTVAAIDSLTKCVFDSQSNG